MVTITKPEPIMKANVTRDLRPKLRVEFAPELMHQSDYGFKWYYIELTRTETTQLIAALKSQRKRKSLK